MCLAFKTLESKMQNNVRFRWVLASRVKKHFMGSSFMLFARGRINNGVKYYSVVFKLEMQKVDPFL